MVAYIALNIVVCVLAAIFLMISHELVKVFVYWCCNGGHFSGKTSPWKVWRYIDPIGVILAIVCNVTISKPHFFRIREKKTNLLLGITGLSFLLIAFGFSIWILRYIYGGFEGLEGMESLPWIQQFPAMLVEYISILSIGMFMANLFPVSTFDMGLIIAGCSAPSCAGWACAHS